MKKKTFLTALCGLLTAISVVLMLSTYIIPVFTYVSPMLAGAVIAFTSCVSDKKWALGVYFAVSAVSLIILADKEAALIYIALFGYYPLLKPVLERHKKLLSIVLKLLLFNTAAVLTALCGIYVFSVSPEEYTSLGKFAVPILLALANTALFLYDFALTKYDPVFKMLSKKLLKNIK